MPSHLYGAVVVFDRRSSPSCHRLRSFAVFQPVVGPRVDDDSSARRPTHRKPRRRLGGLRRAGAWHRVRHPHGQVAVAHQHRARLGACPQHWKNAGCDEAKDGIGSPRPSASTTVSASTSWIAACRHQWAQMSTGTSRCKRSTRRWAGFAMLWGAKRRCCSGTSTPIWTATSAPRPCASPRSRRTRAWSAATCRGLRMSGGTHAAENTSSARSMAHLCPRAGGRHSWEKLCAATTAPSQSHVRGEQHSDGSGGAIRAPTHRAHEVGSQVRVRESLPRAMQGVETAKQLQRALEADMGGIQPPAPSQECQVENDRLRERIARLESKRTWLLERAAMEPGEPRRAACRRGAWRCRVRLAKNMRAHAAS